MRALNSPLFRVNSKWKSNWVASHRWVGPHNSFTYRIASPAISSGGEIAANPAKYCGRDSLTAVFNNKVIVSIPLPLRQWACHSHFGKREMKVMARAGEQNRKAWQVGVHAFWMSFKPEEGIRTEAQVVKAVERALDAMKHHFRKPGQGWQGQIWLVASNTDPRHHLQPKKYQLKTVWHVHGWIVSRPSVVFNWLKKYWEARHGWCCSDGQVREPATYGDYMAAQATKSWWRHVGKSTLGEAGKTLRNIYGRRLSPEQAREDYLTRHNEFSSKPSSLGQDRPLLGKSDVFGAATGSALRPVDGTFLSTTTDQSITHPAGLSIYDFNNDLGVDIPLSGEPYDPLDECTWTERPLRPSKPYDESCADLPLSEKADGPCSLPWQFDDLFWPGDWRPAAVRPGLNRAIRCRTVFVQRLLKKDIRRFQRRQMRPCGEGSGRCVFFVIGQWTRKPHRFQSSPRGDYPSQVEQCIHSPP